MLAWRIAKEKYALDRTGIGARTYGGRWNTPGVAVIYAGMTPEISAMETLVHAGDMLPADLVLVRMDLPDDERLYFRCLVADLPSGWDDFPGSTVAVEYGNAFIHSDISLLRKPASRSRGARHPRVLCVHSGACAPGSPDVGSLATTSVAMYIHAGTHLGMIVPSVVMPEASNIIINPNHAAFSNVGMTVIRPFEFDSRLRSD